MPYFVFTVVPSMIGRMSRCTPSRLTSGPCDPSRPAILSISSMKMIPACSTRSTAARATLSMSISFCSSSLRRYSSASGTFTLRRLFFPWKRPGSMSLRLMSTSSTCDPAMISNDGNDFSRTSISTTRESRRPARSCSRKRSRVCCCPSRGAPASSSGSIRRRGVGGGSDRPGGRQKDMEQPIFGVLRRLGAHFLEPLLAHHVDPELDEVANHRFDVAADVADLGELRRFNFQERRLRQPREAPRNLRLADAGRADHQDVLRRDLFGELRRQLLPPRAVAQRDRDRAFRRRLADDVLVELGDDLPRRQSAGGGLGGFGRVDGHYNSSTTI